MMRASGIATTPPRRPATPCPVRKPCARPELRIDHEIPMRTRNPYDFAAFLLRWAVVGLAAAFVLSVFAPGLVDRLRDNLGQQAPRSEATTPLRQGPYSYAEAVVHASPAVVNIYANKITTFRRVYQIPDLTQRLLQYVPGPLMKRRDQSLGSG